MLFDCIYDTKWINTVLLHFRPLSTNWWRRLVSQSRTLWSAYDQMQRRCVSPCECFVYISLLLYWLYTFLCLLFDMNPYCFLASFAFQWSPGAETTSLHRHAGNRANPTIWLQYQVHFSGETDAHSRALFNVFERSIFMLD